ncbi:MAG: hypothetical protein HY525_04900 [Betaproteobacteria bacterium]|nr:hypothetical protein [Betaproteobacteria bacterium]
MEMLLKEMGCGTGMTCWRGLKDLQRLGPATPRFAVKSAQDPTAGFFPCHCRQFLDPRLWASSCNMPRETAKLVSSQKHFS